MKKILALIVVVTLFVSCSTLEDLGMNPDFKIDSIAIESLDLDGMTFRCDYTVTNPYPIGIRLAELDLDIMYNGSLFSTVESQNGLNLSASSRNKNSAVFRLSYDQIINLARGANSSSTLPFTLDVQAGFDISSVPYLSDSVFRVNYSHDFEVPVFKPEITVVKSNLIYPSADEIAQALINSGVNFLQAAVQAGQIASGQSLGESVMSSLDLDFGLAMEIQVNNRGGSQFEFDLNSCSISTGSGSIANLNILSGNSVRNSGDIVKLEATINPVETGSLLSDLMSGYSSAIILSLDSNIAFPGTIFSNGIPVVFEEEYNLRF